MKRLTQVSRTLALLLAPYVIGAQSPQPESFRQRHLTLDLAIDFAAQRIGGSATYDLENWTSAPATRVSFALNRLMEASGVRVAGKSPTYSQRIARFTDLPMMQVNLLTVDLGTAVPPGGRVSVRIEYGGNLVGYTETGMLYVRDRVDTAFTILRSEAKAFPELGGLSFAANRTALTVDFSYDVSIRVPSQFRVATGGAATRTTNADGTVTWRYVSEGVSPFLNVAIAPFQMIEAGGLRVSYFPEDSAGARRLMTATRGAIGTLTEWFGPLRTEPRVSIAEIPDGWGSQAHLVGGIIQVAGAFRDPQRMGELYHELSHLWNAVDTERFAPRWNEGLAMFVQNRLREVRDGWPGRAASDSALIVRLRAQLGRDSILRTVPFIKYGEHGVTGNSYSVGRLMFAVLFDLAGEAEFNRIVGGYYRQFPNGGATPDFIAFAERTATRDLRKLFNDWLLTTGWTAHVMTAQSTRQLAEATGNRR